MQEAIMYESFFRSKLPAVFINNCEFKARMFRWTYARDIRMIKNYLQKCADKKETYALLSIT